MPLTQAQQQVADSRARFKVLVSGRRAGKTHLAIREICRQATRPGARVFYVAPSYRMARQICWDALKDRLRPLRWIEKINESDLTITLVNGSKISLRGADNFDALRGVGLTYAVLDEFADMDPKAWTEVLRPTLSDQRGGALFCGTPKGVGNHLYDLYQAAGHQRDWERWSFTTLEAGLIDPEEIEQARADLDESTFRQEYEGSFETFSGVIYRNFDSAATVVDWPIPELAEIHIGADNNVDPHMACAAVRWDNGLYVIEEFKIRGSTSDILSDEIQRRFPTQRIIIYPDPAGNQRRTSSGQTDIMIFQNRGFQVRARHRHPAVKDRINAVNSLLCNARGERRLWINPACRSVIESMVKHQYREGTQTPEADQYSHMADALGYMVEYLYPIKRVINTTDKPNKWTIRTQ